MLSTIVERRGWKHSTIISRSPIQETHSQSMSGVCTPFDMEIKDARRKGFTLDISVEVLENMCNLPNLDNKKEYNWNIEFSLFKSYP